MLGIRARWAARLLVPVHPPPEPERLRRVQVPRPLVLEIREPAALGLELAGQGIAARVERVAQARVLAELEPAAPERPVAVAQAQVVLILALAVLEREQALGQERVPAVPARIQGQALGQAVVPPVPAVVKQSSHGEDFSNPHFSGS